MPTEAAPWEADPPSTPPTLDPAPAAPAPAPSVDIGTAPPADRRQIGAVPDRLMERVQGLEGFNPNAYGDYRQTSIGYGTRARPGERSIDETNARTRLHNELSMHARRVDTAAQRLGIELQDNQRDALISFDFNTGAGDRVLEQAGGDLSRVPDLMDQFVHAGGRRLEGLVNRRRAERGWFTADTASRPFWAEDPADDNAAPWQNDPTDQGTAANTFNQGVRGAIDQGFYAGVDGLARGVAENFPTLPPAATAAVRILSPLAPVINPMEQELLRDYARETQDIRRGVRETFPVDDAYAQSLTGQIVAGLGQAIGTLPTYVIPGFGPASSVGQIYDEGYNDAIQAGASPEEANRAALAYAPAAALDVLSDKLIIGKILKPLQGRITVGQILKSAAITSAGEGMTEAGQQAWLNAVARLQGYDPDRPLDQEVLNSLVVGAVVGGGVTAAGQTAAGLASKSFDFQNDPVATEPTDLGSVNVPGAEAAGADPLATAPGESPYAPPATPAATSTATPPASTAVPAPAPPAPAGKADTRRQDEIAFQDWAKRQRAAAIAHIEHLKSAGRNSDANAIEARMRRDYAESQRKTLTLQARAAWMTLTGDDRDLLKGRLEALLKKNGALTINDIPVDLLNKIGTSELIGLKDAMSRDPQAVLDSLETAAPSTPTQADPAGADKRTDAERRYYQRNTWKQDAAGLGWSTAELAKMSDERLAEIATKRERKPAPTPVAAPPPAPVAAEPPPPAETPAPVAEWQPPRPTERAQPVEARTPEQIIGAKQINLGSPTPEAKQAAGKHIAIMPAFQGGKYQMAEVTAEAIRQTFTAAERAQIDTVVDYFGGGGMWGSYLALSHFPNVQQIVIYELDPHRAAKIQHYHTPGGKTLQEIMDTAEGQRLLASVTEWANMDEATSGTAVGRRLREAADRSASTPELKALAGALRAAQSSARGRAEDASGKKTAEATMARLREIALRDEADARDGVKALRDRGVRVEVRNGNSYEAEPIAGTNVLTVADPPYYKQTGYQGGITGLDTYLQTQKLLQRHAAAGNAIIYTDNAWHIQTPNQAGGMDALGLGVQPDDEVALGKIVDAVDTTAIVPVESRYEILGLRKPTAPAAAGNPVADPRGVGDGQTSEDRPGPDAGGPQQTDQRVEPGDDPSLPPAPAGLSPEERAAEEEMRRQMEEDLRADIPGAIRFSDALKAAGWLPAPDTPAFAEFSGELSRLREFADARKVKKREQNTLAARMFTGTRSLDHLAEILRDRGFPIYGPDDVILFAEELLSRGTDPVAFDQSQEQIDAENTPFSRQANQPGADTRTAAPSERAKEASRLRAIMRDQWRAVGERQGVPVVVFETVDEIPRQLAGETARAAVASGSIVEAYFITGRRSDGTRTRRIAIVRSGAAQIAAARGTTLEQRVRQLALHEIVHHYRSLGALLPKAEQRSYNDVVDGIIKRLQRTEPELLAYLTRPAEQGGYGFDLQDRRSRADLVEEYIARANETTSRLPQWLNEAIAAIARLIRRAFPKLPWLDADVRALVTAARRKAEQLTEAGTDTTRMSAQPVPRPAWLQRIDAAGNPTQGGRTDEDSSLHLGRSLETARRIGSGSDRPGARGGSGVTAESLLEAGALPELNPAAFAAGVSTLTNIGRNEHLVFRPDGSTRAYKVTKPGEYGSRTGVVGYLERLQRSNELFSDDIRLEGAVRDEATGQLRLVISQPWINDARPASQAQIADYFRAKGYLPYSERAYYHTGNGTLISDAEPVNVLVDAEGVVYPIDVIPTQVRESAQEMYENVVRAREDDRTGQIRMSAQPAPGEPEIKQRRYSARVQGDQQIAEPIRENAATYYAAQTEQQWKDDATAIINRQGLDGALNVALTTNPPTATTNALALELVTRLQDAGRYEDAAALIRHTAEGNTSQAQAIRAMALYGRLDATGAQVYAEGLINEAAEAAAASQDPTVEDILKQIQRLREELAKARRKHATDAILDVQEMIKQAGWDAEKMVQIQQRLREILLQSVAEPGTASERLRGILIAAGMDRQKATLLAERALKQFRKRLATARDQMLKQLLKVPPEKIRVPKSQLQKWIELNNNGRLDDETIYGTIAQKFGLPVFTRAMAERIKAAQKVYAAAPEGDLKLAAGARMMDEIHSMVPAELATKIRTIRNMAMLLNPKTILRNLGGNQVLMITDAAADTINAWTIDPLVSLVTGQRARTTAAVAERMKGLAQPWRDFWKGVEYGRSQGHTGGQLFTDGLRHFRDMAKITNAQAWDVRHFRATFRHVFTSRAGRLMEDTLTTVLGGGDRMFHAGAYEASLRNQMETAARNGKPVQAPTPEMMEQALLDANRAILQDENIISGTLLKAQRALNVIGIGKPRDKAGKIKWGEPGAFGLGNAVIPFAQIPGGAITRGVEFSPLGFIRAGYELLAPLLSRTRRFDQKAFGDAFSRAIVGSTGYLLGAWLLKLGIISALPDDDKDLEAMRKAAGLGGLRVNVSELKRRLLTLNFTGGGSMFDAAQDGDLVVSYDWLQPAAFTVAAGAQAMVEQQKTQQAATQGKVPKAATSLVAGLLGGWRGFEHMSVLNGLKRFAQSTGQRESFLEGAVDQLIELPASFVPTVVKDVNNLLDNTLRESRPGASDIAAALASVLTRLPMAGDFPPRFDVFGQAMERYQYGGNSVWNVMVNPAFATQVRKTPQLAELERLYAATLDGNVTPSTRQRLITVNGRQRELTDEELAQFKYTSGRAAADRLTMMISSPAWARMPDAMRVRYVGAAFSDASAAAKVLLFGDRPRQPDRGTIQAARQIRGAGYDQPYPPQ